MTSLVEKVRSLDANLEAAEIPHAFGGAFALAYHVQEPRATRDIDLNCFATTNHAREVFAALPSDIRWDANDIEEVERVGQVRVFWDDTPVDLFFSTHPFHGRAAATSELVPFADGTIPILGATELAVFKVFFDRTRDWADIEAMVEAGTLDVHAVIGWTVDLLGSDAEPRITRLRALADREPQSAPPRFAP
jgi:hypothetical protein